MQYLFFRALNVRFTTDRFIDGELRMRILTWDKQNNAIGIWVHTKIIREWSIHFKLGPLYLLKSHFDFFECDCYLVCVHMCGSGNVCAIACGNVCARLRICEISNNFVHSHSCTGAGAAKILAAYRFDNWQSTSIVSYFPKKIAWHIWLKKFVFMFALIF